MIRSICILLIGLSLGACATTPSSEPGPLERPGSADYAYDEHTPSSEYMIMAGRAYAAGQYGNALAQYKAAAYWSDKFAQYNVGMLHLRGEGTEYDPLRGWAWLELSAERGYPQFREAADALRAMFNASERQRAQSILENELLPVYGDEATRGRTAREMRFRLRQSTGSRTGSRALLGMLTIYDDTGFPRDGDEFYDPAKWDFERIVAYETRLMELVHDGQVEVRELELDEP